MMKVRDDSEEDAPLKFYPLNYECEEGKEERKGREGEMEVLKGKY